MSNDCSAASGCFVWSACSFGVGCGLTYGLATAGFSDCSGLFYGIAGGAIGFVAALLCMVVLGLMFGD